MACVSVRGGVVHALAGTVGRSNVVAVAFHPSAACGATLNVAVVRVLWTRAANVSHVRELPCVPVDAVGGVTKCQVAWQETMAGLYRLQVTLDGTKVRPLSLRTLPKCFQSAFSEPTAPLLSAPPRQLVARRSSPRVHLPAIAESHEAAVQVGCRDNISPCANPWSIAVQPAVPSLSTSFLQAPLVFPALAGEDIAAAAPLSLTLRDAFGNGVYPGALAAAAWSGPQVCVCVCMPPLRLS